MSDRFLLRCAVSLAAICTALPAHAQEAQEASEDAGLADIVVTAQRREESLQRAAVAVTAITGAALDSAGITEVVDLQKLVPALAVAPTGGTTSFFLRGVGTNSQNSFAENAVAFNFNGVYVARPSGPAGVFYDLARVEVVKGPQGTLYGRNATGGAINVIPRKPELGKFGGDIRAEYGNYDSKKASAALNIPIGNSAALRIAGQVVDRDGFLSDGYSDDRGEGVRASLLVEPAAGWSVLLVGDYFNQHGKGWGSVLLPNSRFAVPDINRHIGISSPEAQAAIRTLASTLFAPPFCGGPGGFVTSGCIDLPADNGFLDNQFYGLSATLEGDLGFATLTIQPAWRKSDINFVTYLPGFRGEVVEDAEQYSVEMRLSSNGNGPLRYVLGAFYFSEDQNALNFFRQGDLSTTRFTPNIKTESYAAFGQFTYSLTDTFRLVAGGRYTKETKDQLTATVSGGRPGPVNPPLGAPFPGALSFERFTWKAGVEWDAGPSSLVYADVATGFKSGGFFVAAPPENTFAPETLTAYTLGTKNRFFNNKLQLNLEAFYWDYTNQQITFVGGVRTAGGIFAQGSRTENAGKSRIYGLEAEVRFQPTRNDRFDMNVQYLNGKYNSLQTANFSATGAPVATGCTILGSRLANPGVPGNNARFFDLDCSGKPAVQAPEWTLGLGYERGFDVSDKMRLLLGARTSIESSRFLNANYREDEKQGSFMMSDAYVTLEGDGGRWTITGFISNIEDKEVLVRAGTRPILDFSVGTFAPPRTYGIRMGYSF
ncbi:MAG: TonB-dependent receptor [Novosphingobium meiothermophilum]|uniref:TonB-dependent receptor n=1 Tax=Novosphingobium TaxID=165696 RepID=UPI000D6E19B6|nr:MULTISPECIES: TonB-dependent receptor [Novosphingobium]